MFRLPVNQICLIPNILLPEYDVSGSPVKHFWCPSLWVFESTGTLHIYSETNRQPFPSGNTKFAGQENHYVLNLLNRLDGEPVEMLNSESTAQEWPVRCRDKPPQTQLPCFSRLLSNSASRMFENGQMKCMTVTMTSVRSKRTPSSVTIMMEARGVNYLPQKLSL